jgi:hypothetical protein
MTVCNILLLSSLCATTMAQNVTSRTNEYEFDLADASKKVNTTFPVVSWIAPNDETTFLHGNEYVVKFAVESTSAITNVTISIRPTSGAAPKVSQSIRFEASENLRPTIEQNVTLMDGRNVVEVVAENSDGVKTVSQKTIQVTNISMDDVAKLDRTDYALIFATDQYDNWPDLVNPVFDSRTIGDELSSTYGYKVEVLENPTQEQILKKLREYIERDYKPMDQLFIFFAGHGNYDQTFNEGYLVPREALIKDEAKTSYLSYHRLRSVINNIPCEHIFLTMDVCFGGTFDQNLSADEGSYAEKSASDLIAKKLMYKTRKFLMSGGKEYVSDGVPGRHSPFARAFLEALRSNGGKDGILTLGEITPYVLKLKVAPRTGEFGDNAPGSDFIFVSK